MKKLIIITSFAFLFSVVTFTAKAENICVCTPSNPQGECQNTTPTPTETKETGILQVGDCVIPHQGSTCEVKIHHKVFNSTSNAAFVKDENQIMVGYSGNEQWTKVAITHGKHGFNLIDWPFGWIAYEDGEATCEVGSKWNGTICKPDVQTLVCNAGTYLLNGVCVPIIQTLNCGAGTYPLNGACVPIVQTTNCGTGTYLLNGACVPIQTTNCNAGTYLLNGVCVANQTTTCSTGYYSLNGSCVPIQTLNCGPDAYVSNGVCVATRVVTRTVVRNVVNRVTRNTTNTQNTVTPVSFANTVGTNSPIMLTIVNKYQTFGNNDVVDYTITYKNIGNTVLTKALLQVVVPNGIVITNSSSGGTYQQKDNTLSVSLNDLLPNQEGVVYVQGRVDSIVFNNSKIITKAIIIYTTINNTQESAMAYTSNESMNIVSKNNLGASAFGISGVSFGLIGWLILIILILLIVLLVRYFSRPRMVYPPHYDNHTNGH